MIRSALALFALLVPSATTLPAAGAAVAGAAPPITLPALRQWTPGGTTYAFNAASRIVVQPGLTAVAQAFAAEVRALTGVAVPVVPGPARAGDVELAVGDVFGLSAEGYRAEVGSVLRVTGREAGVFYGTRSVLQWLRQGRTVQGGTAVDWPTYPERGLMVDVGRKYFSLAWLKNQVREMAYLKLNYLHLHLNDVHGYRLESASHPEIVSAQYYTRAEILDLIAYARGYRVQVVPELDFPGHMDAILAQHPQLRLASRTGAVSNSFIDLSKPAAYDLMGDLITENMSLFPSRYWHIGADEYVTDYAQYPQLEAYARQRFGPDATGKDAYHGYINWASALVRAAGKTPRAWNDGLKPGGFTVPIDSGIVIEHWSRSGPPPWFGPAYTAQQLVDAGHLVQNASFTPTYYTTGGWAAPFNVPPAVMYDTWDPGLFVDGTRLRDPGKNLGSLIHVWCDEPDAQTEAQIGTAIFHRLQVLAQATWGTPKPPLYVFFLPVIDAVGHPS